MSFANAPGFSSLLEALNPFAAFTSPTLLGNGADGDVVISSNTTLTRDMQYRNLTVNAGIVLTTAGFKIFVAETATINGTIRNNGSNGVTSSGAQAAGGAGAPTGSLLGGSAGGAGGLAGAAGVAGANSDPVFAAGNGGRGGNSLTNVAAGIGGVAVGGTVLPVLDTDMLNALATQRGGAGGGGGGSNAGAFGGGGGGGGGMILVAADVLAGSGVIEANGGAGGNGNTQASSGGGGGGGGGTVVLLYGSKTLATAQALGGAAGLDTINQSAINREGPGSPGYVIERQMS